MTSSGRLLLLLLMMMMMTVEIQSATGLTLTCFSCTSSATKPACADPFDASGVDIGRCTSQLHCVAIRMTGGSLHADVWYRGCNDSCAWLKEQVLGSKPDCHETFCQTNECNSVAVEPPSTTSAPTTDQPHVAQTTTKSSATLVVLDTVVATLLASVLATAVVGDRLIN